MKIARSGLSHFHRTARGSNCSSLQSAGIGLGLFFLCLLLAGCPKENPTIQAIPNDLANQSGGTLQITGSGFTPGNPIRVGVLNPPGATSPWGQAAGNADGSGNINITVSYSWDTSSTLPGCASGNSSGSLTSLNVTAADSSTHAFGAAQAQVKNCGWANLQVSQHQ